MAGELCTHLLESVRHHVPHSPALILEQAPQGGKKNAMAALLLLGDGFCNCNEYIHCQKPHTILVVASQMLEKRNHFLDDDGSWHSLDKLCQVACSLSPNHRRVIVNKRSILLPQPFLGGGCSSGVWDVVEAGRGDLGGKPICL